MDKLDMLVSIVITCYNRADMVCRALDSVWKQTYRPIELIVVDDGSKDNSFEVIQEWHKNHPDTEDFTTVARSFPNGKLCVARNRGLEMAHGEFIQYVDDDDWLYPEAIQKKVARLREMPDVDLLVNQIDFISNGKKTHTTNITVPGPEDNPIVYLLRHECLLSATLMFRTDTLRRIGQWKAGLIFADDMEITMRLAIYGGKFALVDESLSGCRIHSQVRQCTTIRDRLPDDFCPLLYLGLFELAQKNDKDTQENREAFAQKLKEDANDFVRIGRFSSAMCCMQAAESVLVGNTNLAQLQKTGGVPFTWRMKACYWSFRNALKNLLKNLLRR